jgi:hypothetical protein
MSDFISQLSAPCSRDRALAAATAGRLHSLIAEPLLRDLLLDSSPFVSSRASRISIGEVRFTALEALQKVLLAHGRPMDLGKVVVRKSMAAEEVDGIFATQSESVLLGVASAAEGILQSRVAPDAVHVDVLRKYVTLQLLDLVPYRMEEVDPATYTTRLQEEVRESQLLSERPRPHLRVADRNAPSRVFGFVYRGKRGLVVLDFAEGVGADYAVQILSAVMGPKIQRAIVEDGVTALNPDGTVKVGELIDTSTADPIVVLQSLRIYVEDRYHTQIVE